jgi:hypothetical protein
MALGIDRHAEFSSLARPEQHLAAILALDAASKQTFVAPKFFAILATDTISGSL